MKLLQYVYDMLNKLCSDFHRNNLKNVEVFTQSIRGLVRTFGQCIYIHLHVWNNMDMNQGSLLMVQFSDVNKKYL